ncbi:MAG: HAD family hydrolase [Phycisphaerales bacterium]|nr:MAG: HAD family hydrolase [Phycisphaerales bacterium]
MIATVVFDMDDTLYDEIDYCKSGFACVAEYIANQPSTPPAGPIFSALWEQFTTGNHTRTFNAALNELGIDYDAKLIGELVGLYRNHIPIIVLPQDSRDVLSDLSDRYTLAMLTDGFLPAQQLKVRALGIEKYFRCIIYTEELGREFWKPSPVGFEKLLEAVGGSADAAAYVADNEEKDFIAPNKLGFSTIQLIRPARIHTSSSHNPDAAAQHKIDKISKLPALLDRLQG